MLFNPDMTKQSVAVVFSKKVLATEFGQLDFNGTPQNKRKKPNTLG